MYRFSLPKPEFRFEVLIPKRASPHAVKPAAHLVLLAKVNLFDGSSTISNCLPLKSAAV